jgi:hypothetical protein
MIRGRGRLFSVTEPLIPGNLVRPTDGYSVLGPLHHERHEVREHQDTEGENMPPHQHSRPSFISSCEAVKARGPAGTALDHPAPWQPHEDFLRLRPFDHFESHPLVGSVLPRSGAGIALTHRGHLHRKVSTAICPLLPLLAFAPIGARAGATFGAGLQGPTIENDRRGMRPSAKRHSIRRSSLMASNTPALSQR